MKTLRTFQNPGEAGFAQSLLESSGIAAVLEHEAGALAMPTGVAAVRLRVPDEQCEDAERILGDYPVRFEPSDEDVPRVGFWRGGIYGLGMLAGFLFLIRVGGGSCQVTGVGVFFVFLLSALVGANLPKRRVIEGGKV